jgi:integrase
MYASHRMHDEWYGNYQEFLFFTALRQSEVFALEVDDCDLVDGKISITKAVVKGQPKNRTKTNQDREANLRPRALQVLHAQLSLRAKMVAAGMINHNRVFFTAVGEPFVNTFLPYRRWTEVLETLPLRYREPYNSRHSFISWRLMVGHNRLLVARVARSADIRTFRGKSLLFKNLFYRPTGNLFFPGHLGKFMCPGSVKTGQAFSRHPLPGAAGTKLSLEGNAGFC